MPSVKRIDLSEELLRIAGDMDNAGRCGREYCVSKYDSDLLRDAVRWMEARRDDPSCPPEVGRLVAAARDFLAAWDRGGFFRGPMSDQLRAALVPFERPAAGDGKNP